MLRSEGSLPHPVRGIAEDPYGWVQLCSSKISTERLEAGIDLRPLF